MRDLVCGWGQGSKLRRDEGSIRASIAAVHPNGGKDLPDGQIFHASGPSQEGWTIVAIHDSQESWQRFRDDKLMPTLQAGVEGGFQSPPQEMTFEVETQQTA